MVPLTVVLDGQGLLDGVEVTPAEFYRRLPGAATHPTTSQPSPGSFVEVYRELLEDHEEIVSVHISDRLSGTLASARQAAEMVDRERIHPVDSRFASMPLGALSLVAAAAADRGLGAAETVGEVTRVGSDLRCHFAVSTLEFLRRGGRIGSARALLGSVLQVKPILAIEGGAVVPLEQVRTHARAISRLVELTRLVDRGRGLVVVIGHAGAGEVAQEMAGRLEDLAESLLIQPLGPVVGAHTGPGAVGIAAYPAELFPLGLGSDASVTARR